MSVHGGAAFPFHYGKFLIRNELQVNVSYFKCNVVFHRPDPDPTSQRVENQIRIQRNMKTRSGQKDQIPILIQTPAS